MAIVSPETKVKATWTDKPLAGRQRQSDASEKLDVAVSEANDLPTYLADSVNLDAFGRLRVANTGGRADIEFIYDKQPLLMDEITSGGGTITHNAATRDVSLAVNDANNGTTADFPLHYYTPYTPGSGQKIDITGNLDAAGIGGGVCSIFLRNNGVDAVNLPQTSWMNGVPDADWGKSQIFSMDFQSLKVGRVRFALIRNGVAVTVHEIYNDNVRVNGFWQFPEQPLHWRIYNAGGNTISEIGYFGNNNGIGFRYTMPANANAQALAICGTVKSESGRDLNEMAGLPFSADRGVSAKSVSTTLVPVLSLRIAPTFNSLTNRMLAIPNAFGIQSDNPLRYVFLYRPTLTGAAFANVNATYSGMQFDIAATALTGGIRVYSNYITSGNNQDTFARGVLGRVLLALGNTGTNDILTLAAVRTGASNASVLASIEWLEIR